MRDAAAIGVRFVVQTNSAWWLLHNDGAESDVANGTATVAAVFSPVLGCEQASYIFIVECRHRHKDDVIWPDMCNLS